MTTASRPTTSRRARTVVAGLLATTLLATAACSADGNDSAKSPGPSGGASTAPSSTTAPQPLDAAWDDFRTVADRLPARTLKMPHLTGTKSFTAAQVGILASLVKRTMARSIDPKLTTMSQDDAVHYVLDGTYSGTSSTVYSRLNDLTGGSDWSYRVVNQFPTNATVGKTEIIDIRWKWLEQQTDDHGPRIDVDLQAFTRTPVTYNGQTYPIVVRRSVAASSYRPDGGPTYWPALSFNTYPYGNDGCYLTSTRYPGEDRQVGPGPRLVPSQRPKMVREDGNDLREWLSPKALAPGSKASKSLIWPNYTVEQEAKDKYAAKTTMKQRKHALAERKTRCSTPGA